MRYRVCVSDFEQLKEALTLPDLEYVYAGVELLSEKVRDRSKIIAVPPVFVSDESKMRDSLNKIKRLGFSRVLAHTIGHIPLIREAGLHVHGGFRLNITNSLSMKQYESFGLHDAVLSAELSLPRLKSVSHKIPVGFIAYGRLPLMLLRKVPDGDALTDRKGKVFPIVRGAGECELLNPDTLILSDRISDFAALDFAVLNISAGESVLRVLEMYEKAIPPEKNFTRGLYYK